MKIGNPVQLANLPPIAWKNGAGVTRTLAVEPENAGFDDFLWRLSFAEITAAGDFSPFPGVDRTLMLWRGRGMVLTPKSVESVTLSQPLETYAFRGEEEIAARPVDGPTIDFNVMVRRGQARAAIHRYESETRITRNARWAIFICAKGSFRLLFPSGEECLLCADEALSISDLIDGVKMLPDTIGAAMVGVLIDPMDTPLSAS
ncbi:MAG: HutD family protein [Edaphobacter sp.]